jgi:hypothetical protein
MFCSPKNTPAYIRILVTGLVVAASPVLAVGPIENVAPVEVAPAPAAVAPAPAPTAVATAPAAVARTAGTQRPDTDLFDAPLGKKLRVRLLRRAKPTPAALPVGMVSSDEICLAGKFAACSE